MKVSLLSNETNSQDPLAVHSRIFVGNLNTFQCSKSDVEQIFQRYGHLTAISMHKGYAFVQFSNPVEAKNAADGEDGRLVLNQNIDVNLVSQPKIHQQQQVANTKHVFQASSTVGRHQSHSSSNTTAASCSVSAAAALKLSTSRFQHLLVNGATSGVVSAAAAGGGVIQPKLSVSIQKRRKRRRHHQLNRISNRSEFLLDSSTTSKSLRMSGSGLMLMASNHHQYSGISPTLSTSSTSSSASTSSLESSSGSPSALSSSQVVPGELFPGCYRMSTTGGPVQPQQQQLNHNGQWYPGCYANGGINNNYLIPTHVYDIPNEVIDDGGTPQQQPPPVNSEEETQEVMLYDGNNNPVSSWEEFLLTTNKSGPDHGDILICGNCRELFHDLEHLLEHRRTTCQLRVVCECRNTAKMDAENMVLFCRMCRKQFSHPLALLQHVQHVHQIKIFETEHDYTPDKDLVAATVPHHHGELKRNGSEEGTMPTAIMLVE